MEAEVKLAKTCRVGKMRTVIPAVGTAQVEHVGSTVINTKIRATPQTLLVVCVAAGRESARMMRAGLTLMAMAAIGTVAAIDVL